jgi:hypothetical protein
MKRRKISKKWRWLRRKHRGDGDSGIHSTAKQAHASGGDGDGDGDQGAFGDRGGNASGHGLTEEPTTVGTKDVLISI